MKPKNNPLGAKSNDEWETPPELFESLNREFGFTLDACASKTNHKVARWYSIDGSGLGHDGLTVTWQQETVWVNPPFSDIGAWVEKAYEETRYAGTTVVMLLPANTDTKWFSKYCTKAEVRLLTEGRVAFLDQSKKAIKGNPRGSMVVIFRLGIKSGIKTVPLKSVLQNVEDDRMVIQPAPGYGPEWQSR